MSSSQRNNTFLADPVWGSKELARAITSSSLEANMNKMVEIRLEELPERLIRAGNEPLLLVEVSGQADTDDSWKEMKLALEDGERGRDTQKEV